MSVLVVGNRVRYGYRYGYIFDIRGTVALVIPERCGIEDCHLPHAIPLRNLTAAPLSTQDGVE